MHFLQKQSDYFSNDPRILLCREIWGIAFARPGRAIALKLNAVHAKMLKIKRVPLVATHEIGIAHQTNYD